MTPAEAWSILGLAPTRDTADIRRAYARVLKATNPEDDAEGFKALREAYEWALARARSGPAPRAAPPIDPAQELTGASPRSATSPAATSPAPAAAREDAAAHDRLIRRFAALLRDSSPAESGALRAALSAVLDAPAMDDITIRWRVEVRLARLLLDTAPRGDAVLDLAIERLGWDRLGALRGVDAAIARVVKRQEEIQRLTFMRAKRDDAWSALVRPPSGLRRWRNLLTPGLDEQVRRRLVELPSDPTLVAGRLDPAALDWWRGQLSRPRLGAWVINLTLFATFIAGIVALGQPTAPVQALLIAAAPALAAAAWFHLVVRPRHRLMARWGGRAPARLSAGWILAAAPLALAGALIPTGLIGDLVVGVAAAGLAIWAALTGTPDLNATVLDWRVRAVLTQGWLMGWWAAIVGALPDASRLRISMIAFALAIAGACGAGSLRALIAGSAHRGVIRAAFGVLVLAAMASSALWGGLSYARPMVAALVMLTVFFSHPLRAPHALGTRVYLVLCWVALVRWLSLVGDDSSSTDKLFVGVSLAVVGALGLSVLLSALPSPRIPARKEGPWGRRPGWRFGR